MKIGVLGGTFDPVHYGHLHLAREAKKKLGLARVLFVPAFLAPHKTQKKKSIAPAANRVAMLRAALKGKKGFGIFPYEIRSRRKVYTFETLKTLRKKFGSSAELYFLTGADSVKDLAAWKNPETVLRLSTFVAAARPGFKRTGKFKDRVLWLKIRPLDVSSSEIRARVRKGLDLRGLVPRQVAVYIGKNKLYKK